MIEVQDIVFIFSVDHTSLWTIESNVEWPVSPLASLHTYSQPITYEQHIFYNSFSSTESYVNVDKILFTEAPSKWIMFRIDWNRRDSGKECNLVNLQFSMLIGRSSIVCHLKRHAGLCQNISNEALENLTSLQEVYHLPHLLEIIQMRTTLWATISN
jgi:hypothetical protein